MTHKMAHDEIGLEAEVELAKLKRQYRIMENDRETCVEDARLQLRHQKEIIDHLEHEKAEILIAIQIAKSKMFNIQDEEIGKKLDCLLTKRVKYIDLINNEKQQIVELDKQISKVR